MTGRRSTTLLYQTITASLAMGIRPYYLKSRIFSIFAKNNHL
jgi:hypothetical protein